MICEEQGVRLYGDFLCWSTRRSKVGFSIVYQTVGYALARVTLVRTALRPLS